MRTVLASRVSIVAKPDASSTAGPLRPHPWISPTGNQLAHHSAARPSQKHADLARVALVNISQECHVPVISATQNLAYASRRHWSLVLAASASMCAARGERILGQVRCALTTQQISEAIERGLHGELAVYALRGAGRRDNPGNWQRRVYAISTGRALRKSPACGRTDFTGWQRHAGSCEVDHPCYLISVRRAHRRLPAPQS